METVKVSKVGSQLDVIPTIYNVFGLVAQVCYTTADGSNTYTYKKEQDMMTLEQFNAQCETDGCIKGEWR